MKRSYLQFPKRAAKIQSRQAGLINFVNAAYKTDGEPSEETKALLAKVKETVENQTRGFQNEDQVKGIINKVLEGMPIDALRSFDPAKFQESITKVAGEVEKLSQQRTQNTNQRINVIQEFLDKNVDNVRSLFTNKVNGAEIKLNVRAAAVMTTGNTVDNTAVPDDILESFTQLEFVKKRRPRQYVYDMADRTIVAEVDKYLTWLEEGDEEGAFAIVAEGATKPLVSYDIVRNVSTAKKVAAKYIITEEFAKFYKEAYRIIRELIMDKGERDYSAILTTDLLADAAGYTGTALDGQYVNPTDYHAIGAVAAQIQSLNFNPDMLILNPQDMWRIALQQNTQGSFFLPIPMYNPDGETIMMGFTVRTSNYVPVGTAILGESGLWKIRDEAWTIRIGYGVTVTGSSPVTSVVSDFDNNQMRVIVEKFFHDYIATAHTGSFVSFNFDVVKALLTQA
ncbi:hypothetical protein VF04_35050 [Nostoc linckia z7]|uniref:Major capsid protein n=1 Tax=Nostoc linckia z7 TaxID=1628745 RepID=A0ABX4KFF1_NOSLI|nr:hypothetical protein [Nostoc linckia]PHJ53865.1 hypothetical protein VF02_37080 [Nostoc linckia z1]PHJ59281.1 hypothetical protein VF05_32325 [Nostoc linckia z3]PHJ63676.1 hypothetical protein VF03_30200 [Nostoc linckia z2]PHJ73862.1 hypothetical protein VF06_35690 [Nostoc linckia z4]PHJ87197.1 hypothetical protein VF04_35050 [Nostoc linckia z7]